MRNSNRIFAIAAAAAIMSLTLSACSGGGDGAGGAVAPADKPITTTGVAAVGSPIVGGAVTLKCASGGTASATTSATGSWAVALSNADYPCVARVTGGTANGVALPNPMHSVAQAAGTTNITPLTNMVTAIVSDQDPAAWYDTAKSADLGSVVTTTTMSNAVDELKVVLTTLPGKPELPVGFNPVTSTFEAVRGNAGDDLLETYNTTLVASGLTQATAATQVAAGQALTQGASAFKAFMPSKLTQVFAGSAALVNGKVAFVINDMPVSAAVDADGNLTTLDAGSPFSGVVSLFGNSLGQVCTVGAGSNSQFMHSKYLFMAPDAGWTEVTDVTEMYGKTFNEYEDCGVFHTVTITASGEMFVTDLNGVSDSPTPAAIVTALFSTQGYTKEANTGYAIAKAYKKVVDGSTRYAYIFNGGDVNEPRDYALLAVQQ